ncbi:MAG TPA: copper chaperone PCu(A)C [Anaerolineales bacterium]|nr:copper chaperone PCu(A)C [Anaerolineales bacterium]
MSWKKVFGTLLALLLLVGCQPKSSTLEVQNAWARPSIAGQNDAVYFVIANGTSQDDTLLSASVEIASSTELHMSMSEANDVMTMKPMQEVAVPAHQNVEFAPGGYHVMLVGLAKPLEAGDTFPIRLIFKTAGQIQVQVTVKEQ